MKKKKIIIVFGTRPEAIKMAPVCHALQADFNTKICVTGQHREMLDQVLEIFKIKPDYDLNIMKQGQDLFDITTEILKKFKEILTKEQPDIVLVHGDTSTAMAAALTCFYNKTAVGHVEAGLRTFNLYSPYPEEFNRKFISTIADFHFAPTEEAKKNLLTENISDKNIYVVGNTVIDALKIAVKKAKKHEFETTITQKVPFLGRDEANKKIVLITGHRRENFGEGFENMCEAIKEVARLNPEVNFVYPVHLNPQVLSPVNKILTSLENVYLIKPLDYLSFVKLMEKSYMILTDSGGIQEEAPSLGKPVLVMRDTTERPEAVKAGTVRLVGSEKDKIIYQTDLLLNNLEEYEMMSSSHNPYGNGNSSEAINTILTRSLL